MTPGRPRSSLAFIMEGSESPINCPDQSGRQREHSTGVPRPALESEQPLGELLQLPHPLTYHLLVGTILTWGFQEGRKITHSPWHSAWHITGTQ